MASDPWFKRYAANVLSGYALKAIQLLLSIVAIPLLLTSLGERDYGWLIFLSTTVGYFGILNLGISDAMARYVAEYYQEDNLEELRRLVTTVVALFAAVGAIAAAAIFLATLCHWNMEEERTLKLMFAMTGVLYVFAWPLLAIKGVFVGLQRQPYLSSMLGVGRIVCVTSAIVLAWFGWALPYVFIVMNVDQLILPPLLVRRLTKCLSGPLIRPSFFAISSVRRVLSFSSWMMLSRVATFLEYQVDTLLVLIFVGPAGVALYTVICTPFRLVQQVSGIAVAAIVPVIASRAAKSVPMVGTIKAGAIAHNAVIASICVLLYLFSDILLNRWLSGRYEESYWLIKTLILFQVVWQSNAFLGGCINGLGHSKPLGLIAVVTGVSNFCLSVFLVQKMGTEGVVVGTLVAGLLAVPFATWCFPPLAGLARHEYLKLIIIAHLPAFVLGAALVLFKGDLPLYCSVAVLPVVVVSLVFSLRTTVSLMRSPRLV